MMFDGQRLFSHLVGKTKVEESEVGEAADLFALGAAMQ